MTSKHTRSLASHTHAALLCVALAGCAHSQSQSPAGVGVSTEPMAASPMPASMALLLPTLLADAAQRSGVPKDRLQVIRALAVTWSDGSLGCPQPGFAYTQALVAGWMVSIAVPSALAPLLYHGSDRGGWLYCPAGRAQQPLPAKTDPRI